MASPGACRRSPRHAGFAGPAAAAPQAPSDALHLDARGGSILPGLVEGHNHRMKVTGHCRATEGIKNALRAGYDTIEHGTFMDDEAELKPKPMTIENAQGHSPSTAMW